MSAEKAVQMAIDHIEAHLREKRHEDIDDENVSRHQNCCYCSCSLPLAPKDYPKQCLRSRWEADEFIKVRPEVQSLTVRVEGRPGVP